MRIVKNVWQKIATYCISARLHNICISFCLVGCVCTHTTPALVESESDVCVHAGGCWCWVGLYRPSSVRPSLLVVGFVSSRLSGYGRIRSAPHRLYLLLDGFGSAVLVSSQFGEGGVHLVGQGLVSVLVDSQLVCEWAQRNLRDCADWGRNIRKLRLVKGKFIAIHILHTIHKNKYFFLYMI